MAKLEYSREALGVLKNFHRCDAVVFVEGDDDEYFWRVIFRLCADLKIEPKPMGGSASLDAQIDRIITEDLPVLAARDADFLACTGRGTKDARIVYTSGYSIENTLFTRGAVTSMSHLWTRGRNGDLKIACDEWFDSLGSDLANLIKLDAANYHHNTGCDVLGDGFARFSESPQSSKLDALKVKAHEKKVGKQISDAMVAAIDLGKDAITWIRGHFLQSAVMQFLQDQARNSGVNKKPTYPGLYAEAMHYLSHNLNSSHPHYRHYRRTTKAAAAAVRTKNKKLRA
ncbi:DUF4435 domain-containing protein [Achromobacter sp.]|uniref:DUF4435 domain-containing protein n=1 Tax=Achromobacter sp. TaxID=134375 RepID=UPI0028A0A67E|nr:DUF4435 domain-containing protein [Achromobacter sp.]